MSEDKQKPTQPSAKPKDLTERLHDFSDQLDKRFEAEIQNERQKPAE